MSRNLNMKGPQAHPNSIVRFRGKKGWSIRQLAARVKLDEWTVRNLEKETGGMKLHAGHKSIFSQVFKCSVEELEQPCISPRNPQMPIRRRRRKSNENLRLGRGSARWAGNLNIPENAHPLVRRLFQIMNQHQIMIKDVSIITGVSVQTISSWRYERSPNLMNMEAALNGLGYRLEIRKDYG